MTRIDPIQWTEKTALLERDQLRTAVNLLIESINGTAGDADRAEQAAIEAKTQAELAAHDANDAKVSAEQAAVEAGKVNQFDSRIKASVNHISVTGTAGGVSIGYATDGVPSPQTQLDIPVLDGMTAGVMTPAQMQEITNGIDTLGRDQDAIKRDYLKRHDVVNEQDITGRIAFMISPFVPVLKHNEYEDHDGTRALNAASARADPALAKTVGDNEFSGIAQFDKLIRHKINWNAVNRPGQGSPYLIYKQVRDVNDKNIESSYIEIGPVTNRYQKHVTIYSFFEEDGSQKDTTVSWLYGADGRMKLTIKDSKGRTKTIYEEDP